MVSARWLAGFIAPLLLCPDWASPSVVEVKAVALVESRAPSWKAVPESARIDVGGLSFKRKVFLEGRSAIPVRAPEVRKALANALKGLKIADRSDTRDVLKAIEEWSAKNLAEIPGPLTCPAAWRSADKVLAEKGGNRFELVRAVTAMLRSAGIPARPAFNGLPMVCLFVVPAGGHGYWTVWDPFNPGASLLHLPILWLPLRSEEVQLVATKPDLMACDPSVEGRRYVSRADAETAFAQVKLTGSFPAGEAEPLPANAGEWWEVWAVGAKYDGITGSRASISFPLPFVIEPQTRCGTRSWAVWSSEPARLRGRPSAHTRTDQELGGILMSVRIDLRPAPVSATTGA